MIAKYPISRISILAAGLASGFSVLVGSAGLLGWTLGIQWLTALRPEYNSMRPNAALAAILCGLALWFLFPTEIGGTRRFLGRAFAIGAGILGLLSLISIITGLHISPDTLLFHYNKWEIPLMGSDQFPMRMGLTAAIGYFFGSLSIFLLSFQSHKISHISPYFAFITGSSGLLGLVGYLYHVNIINQFSNMTVVSVHIALSLLILSIGIVFARPEIKPVVMVWDQGPVGIVTRKLFLPILIIPLILGWIFNKGIKSRWFDFSDGLAFLILFFIMLIALQVGRTQISLAISEKEKKRFQNKLKESEQRWATTLASIGDAVIATNLNGQITYMNKIAEEITGWTVAEALQKPIMEVLDMVDEFTRQKSDNPVGKVLAKKNVVGLANNTILIKKDSTEVMISNSGSPIKDTDGEIRGAVLVFRDITERKKKETELKKLNRTLRALSNSGQALMRAKFNEITFLKNVCNIIIEDCGYRMVWIGYTKNEIDKTVKPIASAGYDNGYTDNININWTDNERSLSPTGKAIRTGEAHLWRETTTDPDFKLWREEAAKRGYVSSLAIPLKDDDKTFGAITIYSEQPDSFLEDEIKLLTELSDDLTYGIKAIRLRNKHKKSEKVLRETRDYLENLINYANALIIVWDPEFKITRFNRAFERLTGLNADQFIGQPLELLFPEKSRADSMALIKPTLSGERFEAVEIPILNSEGLIRTVLWNSATIFDQENNEPIAMIAQGQDITEIKKADEEKNNFIAIMSHELRNPLTPILAGSQLISAILKKNDKDAQELIPESAKIIEQQSQNMAHLLDDLLDISRISRGKIILKKQSINLADCLKHSAKSVQPLISAQRQGLSVILPEQPLYLDADPVRIEQIIVNLLNNAIKYTRPGGKINLIGTRAGDNAQIRILDTGIGIEPDKIDSLFKLFSRQAKSFISTQGELGIGLKLTKDLVTLHDGTISANSLGKNMGSEFIVELPALPENYKLELPEEISLIVFEKLRILVVDDNPSIAKLFSKMLELIGHDSRYCLDGASAIKLAAEYKPQVALIDIGLPDMTGHEVAIQLRKMENEIGNKLKLIAITGYGQEEDVKRSSQAGFDMHIVKPVNMETLEKIIITVNTT